MRDSERKRRGRKIVEKNCGMFSHRGAAADAPEGRRGSTKRGPLVTARAKCSAGKGRG